MPRRNEIKVKSWYEEPAERICPLRDRPIPESRFNAHYLVPKSKDGRVAEGLHGICHRHIHANFAEAEFADQCSTIESLRGAGDPKVRRLGENQTPGMLRSFLHDPTY